METLNRFKNSQALPWAIARAAAVIVFAVVVLAACVALG